MGQSKYVVVWCGVVWCGVVWCGVVWCGVVWCGVVWCGVVWCGVVWCGVVWCGVVWCGVVWCGVVWCGVVWCGVVWCGVVWCGVVWHSGGAYGELWVSGHHDNSCLFASLWSLPHTSFTAPSSPPHLTSSHTTYHTSSHTLHIHHYTNGSLHLPYHISTQGSSKLVPLYIL